MESTKLMNKIHWYPRGSNGYFGVSTRGIRYRVWKSDVTQDFFGSNGFEVFRGGTLNDLITHCERLENGTE